MSSSKLRIVRGLPWRVLLLAAVVCTRLATLPLYPLTDPSEARYANIARVMHETGNWVTPQTAPGEAFWGKPPLSVWASALSMRTFGVNEFGARFPSFLFALITCWITYVWADALARSERGERRAESATTAVVVLLTCLGFFVGAGAVMTDPALVVATTWGLASFWMVAVASDTRRRWRFGFFAALAVGLLAKGPVSVVLVVAPIGLWCLIHRRWAALRALPWRAGPALTVAIAAPWYIVAELKTPGFLKYFIVGENFQRFVVPGWTGDLYGFAHAVPHGTVWLYFAAATLPWSLLAVPAVLAASSRARWRALPEPGLSLVALAVVAPLAFFTLSAHVIWTYALPAIPPFAALLGVRLFATAGRRKFVRFATAAAASVVIVLAGGLVAESSWIADNHSTREIEHAWEAAREAAPGPLVFEQPRTVPSLEFYSDGAARSNVQWPDEIQTHYDVYTSAQFVHIELQPQECRSRRTVVARNPNYVLVREADMPPSCSLD